MTTNEDTAMESTGKANKSTEGSRKIQLPKAVVSPEFLALDIPLRDAWIGTLRDKRDISTAIRNITNTLPGLTHLKRCSAKRLILAFAAPLEASMKTPQSENSEKSFLREEVKNLLASKGFDLSLFEKEIEVIKVPAKAPKSKAQAIRASEIWPLNFHPDPFVEQTLNGSCFDSKHLDIIDECMGACIEAAAREAHGNDDCNGSATIFDPIEGKIIALAASRMDRHPMWHATMLAVDLVARLRNGGAYDLTSTDHQGVSVSRENETRKRKYSGNHDDEPPLAYPMNLLEIAHRLKLETCSTRTLSFSALTNDSEATEGQLADQSAAYLCTNYWVFLLREPCAMCAMALLHSRVSNIFYGVANENRGVLGSRALLHTIPGLNHRYRVWKGIREEECRKTYNQISNRWTSRSDLSLAYNTK